MLHEYVLTGSLKFNISILLRHSNNIAVLSLSIIIIIISIEVSETTVVELTERLLTIRVESTKNAEHV